MERLFQSLKLIIFKKNIKKSKKALQLHEPQIKCNSIYHGTPYGGWTICPDGLNNNSIVYSFGVGEDASFDRSIIEKYGLKVFAFDPTPKSIDWVKKQEWPDQFTFYPIGIDGHDGVVTFYPPENPEHISHSVLERRETADNAIQVNVFRLETIARMLDHEYIDILKMDIEGAEYNVINDFIYNSGIKVRQILIEFHHFLPNVKISQTFDAVEKLNTIGYHIFHVSENGKEYGFIKT
ncbi:MAG: FkbM family methyltransferase [Promethearchaeota archaeon]